MRLYTPPVNTPPVCQAQLISQLQSLFQNKSLPEKTRNLALSFVKNTAPNDRGKLWEFEVKNFLLTQRNFEN